MMDFVSDNAGMIGLILFVSVFVVIVFLAFRPGSKETIESHKNIPFVEEENELR